MPTYKNILSGYVNERKSGEGHYLVITNLSDEDVVIKAGEKLYMNRTPNDKLKQYPKIPHYSQSIKIEDTPPAESNDTTGEDVADEIPF